MLRVKIFITNTKTRKEYKLCEEMPGVTPLTKWLLKNLLTSLGGARDAGSRDVEGIVIPIQPHPRWENADVKQE